MDTSKENLFDFLARTSNIGGSVVALITVAGSVAVQAPGIIAVSLGLVGYASGFLVFSQSKKSVSFDISHSDDELKALQENIASLEHNIDNHKNRLPQEIIDESHSIFAILEEIIPRWKGLESSIEQKHTLDSIITNYFPETINNYLNLPASYYKNASKKQVANEIVEQLETMKTALEKIRDTLYSGVEADIKLQSAFLKEKFVLKENQLKL